MYPGAPLDSPRDRPTPAPRRRIAVALRHRQTHRPHLRPPRGRRPRGRGRAGGMHHRRGPRR
ncbi:hypothetical protein FK529_09075 [Tsukamurella asaccharolytica]|uniref:Uncharacterized protein n=1 Tax=Tsukamurella asaccharolytica TaxID=2592067 RepID=A0A5C5RCB1_9ACTN|nr:hypothetical protein FK529_09075 [Tsukamurella asaccharolytica]